MIEIKWLNGVMYLLDSVVIHKTVRSKQIATQRRQLSGSVEQSRDTLYRETSALTLEC